MFAGTCCQSGGRSPGTSPSLQAGPPQPPRAAGPASAPPRPEEPSRVEEPTLLFRQLSLGVPASV